MKEVKSNGLATASFILALCGLITFGLSSMVGFVLGIVALKQVKVRKQKGEGLAITAVVIGGIVWLFFFIGLVSMM